MGRRRGIHRILNHIKSWNTGGLAYRIAPVVSVIMYGLYSIFLYRYLYNTEATSRPDEGIPRPGSRHLLSSNESTTEGEHRLPWEKCDFELNSGYDKLWTVHHLWWIFYTFIGLAVVCDDFFVPALEVISDKMKLSEDVAGATFMAAGSSAPELFTSVAGLAQESDVGVGTIVGSAVFNILVIISLTGALAGQVLTIDWRPLLRDMVFYAVSIIIFICVSFDGLVQVWEAVILLVLYAVYILVMVFNHRLMNFLGTKLCCTIEVKEDNIEQKAEDEVGEVTPDQLRRGSFQRGSFTGGHARRLSVHHALHRPSVDNLHAEHHKTNNIPNQEKRPLNGSVSEFNGFNKSSSLAVELNENHRRTSLPSSSSDFESADHHNVLYSSISENRPESPHDPMLEKHEVVILDPSEEDEDNGLRICPCDCCPRVRSSPPTLSKPSTCYQKIIYALKWFLYVIAFPYYVLFTFTIPDCSREHTKKWYIGSFICSVIWIFTISLCMTALVGRTGCIMGIDEYTMGLVIIAVGTSVPDCLSSVLVARDGFGDMAVSNAIGSNVFDIDLGIGLPMMIKSLIQKSPVNLLTPELQAIRDEGLLPIIPHVKFGLILLALLITIGILFVITKFRLNKVISISFIILYIAFITYAFIQEIHCHSWKC